MNLANEYRQKSQKKLETIEKRNERTEYPKILKQVELAASRGLFYIYLGKRPTRITTDKLDKDGFKYDVFVNKVSWE